MKYKTIRPYDIKRNNNIQYAYPINGIFPVFARKRSM